MATSDSKQKFTIPIQFKLQKARALSRAFFVRLEGLVPFFLRPSPNDFCIGDSVVKTSFAGGEDKYEINQINKETKFLP